MEYRITADFIVTAESSVAARSRTYDMIESDEHTETISSLEVEEEDPTPYCTGCGAGRMRDCHCGPRADND